MAKSKSPRRRQRSSEISVELRDAWLLTVEQFMDEHLATVFASLGEQATVRTFATLMRESADALERD